MKPQTKMVLDFLQKKGSITNVEANAVIRVRSVSSRISELKRLGYVINKERKTDITGQHYVRYWLVHKTPVGEKLAA